MCFFQTGFFSIKKQFLYFILAAVILNFGQINAKTNSTRQETWTKTKKVLVPVVQFLGGASLLSAGVYFGCIGISC